MSPGFVTQPCVSGRNFKTRLFCLVARIMLPSSGQHIRSPITSVVRLEYSSHTDSFSNSYQTLYHTICTRFRSSDKTCSFRESSHTFPLHLLWVWGQKMGRDSSDGIATRCGLDGRGSNLGGGDIFRTRPDRSWGPPSLLYNG